MKTLVASLAVATLLLVSGPIAQAFQQHPRPHKIAKHRAKGDHHHRHFLKSKKRSKK